MIWFSDKAMVLFSEVLMDMYFPVIDPSQSTNVLTSLYFTLPSEDTRYQKVEKILAIELEFDVVEPHSSSK